MRKLVLKIAVLTLVVALPLSASASNDKPSLFNKLTGSRNDPAIKPYDLSSKGRQGNQRTTENQDFREWEALMTAQEQWAIEQRIEAERQGAAVVASIRNHSIQAMQAAKGGQSMSAAPQSSSKTVYDPDKVRAKATQSSGGTQKGQEGKPRLWNMITGN